MFIRKLTIDVMKRSVISEWQKKRLKDTALINLCVRTTQRCSRLNTDHYINGVTYRVWSAFEGKTNVADSLSRLMFRKLESGEQVGEVVDEFQKGIERINNSSLVTM